MPIYEKSTNQLLTEYLDSNVISGQIIDRDQIIAWFKKNYPKIKSNTVNCHIIKFTTNHRTRIHYNASPSNDKLFQLPDKRLRLYDPNVDPKPIYSNEEIDTQPVAEYGEEEKESNEFAYESHLRDYLKDNLQIIEPGLHLYRDEEDPMITGVEFDAGGKRIDVLALDKDENFVIIELKVSKGYEKVVGQLLRYKAWIKKNLSDSKKIRGIIIAKAITEDLRLAASEASDLTLYEYDLRVEVRKVV